MSGIDEQIFWECDNCGNKYYILKIMGDLYIQALVVVEEKPIMYCLSTDIYDIESDYFAHQYFENYLQCDECDVWLDKRTKVWKEIKEKMLEAFANRTRWLL